jgi:taurine dioxygenase
MTITVTPLTPTIGAELSEVDLTQELDEATIKEIREALLAHLVIFFRDQPMQPQDHVRFARAFGEISLPAFRPKASLSPEVVVLDQTNPRGEGADRWHTDNTYMVEPPMGSVLRGVQIPPAGGDTCFASMYAAYEDLSPRMQSILEGLNAVHDIVPVLQQSVDRGLIEADLAEMRQAWPPVEHPVVCTHPETGRKLLYVNANWTTRLVGMEPDESDTLLRFLLHHVGSPQFQCRFRWTTNAVAFWDNRAVQHFAVADYTERRVMHRVTVAADGRPRA